MHTTQQTSPNQGGNVMYPGKVPGRVKYTFAFGALGKDMIYGMIATFSMIYFTDIIKVAPAFIGIMFFAAKIWDAFNDLFMGMVVDNTRSRFGKFIRIRHFVHRLPPQRRWTLRLCSRCLYPLGYDIYHYGYSVLVYHPEPDF